MKYIALCDAKAHLRVDHDEDDIDITNKIIQASSLVKSYIKTASPYEPSRDANDDVVLDSNDEVEDADAYTYRYEVQAATLLLVQYLYEQTMESRYSIASPGVFLPPEIAALLYPLRDPTLA